MCVAVLYRHDAVGNAAKFIALAKTKEAGGIAICIDLRTGEERLRQWIPVEYRRW